MNRFFFIFFAVINTALFSSYAHGKEFTDENDAGFVLVRVKDDAGQVASARILSPAPMENDKNTVVSSGEAVSVKGESFTIVDMSSVSVSGETGVLWNFLHSEDMNMSARVSVLPEDRFRVAFGCLLKRSTLYASGICVKIFWSENGLSKSDIGLVFENGSRVTTSKQNYPARYPEDWEVDPEPDLYPEQRAWEAHNPKLAETKQDVFLAFNAECKGDIEDIHDDDLGKCLVLTPVYIELYGAVFAPGTSMEVISERTKWGGIPSSFGEMSQNWDFGGIAGNQFLVVLLPHWMMKIGLHEIFCPFCRTNFKWFYPVETATLK